MPRLRERLRTTVSAAWIDSCITSPSLPVVMLLPLPGITTASMVSSSPPTSVQASPVTCPTWLFFLGDAEGVTAHAEIFVQVLRG